MTASASTPKMTHVIFDIDGLLLDTERIYTQASSEICNSYGKEFTWEIKSKQMGQTEQVAAQILIDKLGLSLSVEEYLSILKEKLARLFPTVPLMPGAERLVRHLHKHQVPIAVASGSDQWGYRRKTEGHQELFSLFHHGVMASDDPEVRKGKPAPDVFLVCAQRFGDNPKHDEILVFEDAPNGVESGLAAGMQVVWVPDSRADRAAYQGRATEILDSLEKFRPEDYGFPPFDSS